MKKFMSAAALIALFLTMAIGFTGCNGATNMQNEQLNELVTKYETLVVACETEFANWPVVEEETLIAEQAEAKTALESIRTSFEEIKKMHYDNKDKYEKEGADQAIGVLEGQIQSSEAVLKSIQDRIKQLNDALKQ